VSLETLLVLPIFLALALGMVGLADLLVAEQLLGEASGRAARTAALGGSEEQVRESIRAVLGSERAAHAKIYIGPVNGQSRDKGHGESEHKDRLVAPGEMIEVRVEIAARHATVTFLTPVSGDEPLVGRTVMQRE
jgi:hypothetical protein